MTTAEHRRLADIDLEEVVRWRFSRLLDAGYGWDAALMLAREPQVDLHLAVGLLRDGCAVETAIRIVR